MTAKPTLKFSAGNLVLLVSSLLFTFCAVEIGYRVRLSQTTLYSYNVVSRPFYRFSRELGYNYIPNSHAIAASVRKSQLVFWRTIDVGPYSNLGNGVRSWSHEDIKILAFGDSFTSNPFTQHSWADFASDHLSVITGRNAEVMNLGREGYGVLQILHSAAYHAKEFSPDLVIISFIKDDLTRDRFWRTQVTIDRRERMLNTFSPDSTPGIERANDIFLLHPDLTAEWCERIAANHDGRDQFLSSMNKQYDRLLADNHSKSLFTVTHSYLLDRIRYGDPFHSLRKPEAFLPRIRINDFGEDSTFLHDTQTLKALGIPVMVVLLPEISDLNAREYVLNDRQRSLVQSLEKFTGTRIVNLFDYIGQLDPDCTKYFNFPIGDYHSSKLGANLYAEAIARAVKARYGVFRKGESTTE